MKYRLIAIDMDGTLLNSQNKISSMNKETLTKASQNGILVVLATGRILNSALYYLEFMGLNNPLIASNGALIFCKGNGGIIYESPMDISTIKAVIELAERESVYYYMYNTDTLFSRIVGKDVLRYYETAEHTFKKQRINLVVFDKLSMVLNKDNQKIFKIVIVEDDPIKLSKFRSKLKNIEGISISSSWHNNIEVMNAGVSKGAGIKYLMKKFNIDKSEVMAIGDNENDISMFNAAGLAIGMANGIKGIENYVHAITDTNDQDGVANAVRKYIFNY